MKKKINWQAVRSARHCQLFPLKRSCCAAKAVGLSCLGLRSPASWTSAAAASWF